MNPLLKPLELAYRGVAGLRRQLYRSGFSSPKRLPRPVISIGNIAFGGTGKTPVTIAIAAQLRIRGWRVAVLTRGYGRRGRDIELVSGDDPDRFGDEPALIARSLSGVPVIVGSDRYQAGRRFLDQADCDVFILDDGFQHLRLARDVDVVIDDPAARLLRESRSALGDADIVLERGGGGRFALEIVPVDVMTAGQAGPLQSLSGVKAVVFSALADNSRFHQTCERIGVEITARREFPDHHRYSDQDLAELRSMAARAGALLVTTEKDAVKIRADDISFIRVKARITPEEPFFDRLESALR